MHAVIYTHSHVDHFAGVRGIIDEADVTRRTGSHHRPRRVPRGGDQRERHRRQRHDPAGLVHVRGAAAARAARPHRRRARQGHTAAGHARAHRSHRRHRRVGHRAAHRRRAHRVPAHARHRGAGRDELLLSRPARSSAWPRTAPPTSTTCTRCAAPRCGTRWRGAATSTSRSSCSPPTPTSCSPATTGLDGAATRCSTISASSATPTAIVHDQTMRLANHGLTMTEVAEELTLPDALEIGVLQPRTTTAPSTTTPRRCTSATSAGSTATRPTCTACRRSRPPPGMSTSWAGPTRSSRKARRRRSTPATTGGWPRW